MKRRSYTETLEAVQATQEAIMRLLNGQVITRMDKQDSLLDSIVEEQAATNTHLATLNGNVEQLRKDSDRHQEWLEQDREEIHGLDRCLAELAVRGEYQEDGLKETRDEQKALLTRVWELSVKVVDIGVKVTVVLAILAKLCGVDLGI